MKHALAALLILASPAWAGETPKSTWKPRETWTPRAQLTGQTQTQSQEQLVVNRNDIQVTQSQTGGGRGGSGGGAPVVVAPSMSGANPCAVGLTLGGAGRDGGGALGLLWEDGACQNREIERLMTGMGKVETAKEHQCLTDDKQRRAYYSSGDPCRIDVGGWHQESTRSFWFWNR